MGDDPDLALIKKIIKGDARAFGILIDRHQEFVYTIVFRILKTKEDAEEITQDVFIKIYKSLSTFKLESKFTEGGIKEIISNKKNTLPNKLLLKPYL